MSGGWSVLYRNLGRYSRLAGLGFIGVTAALLAISVYYNSVVFQVDSVVTFLAAIVLLFRDPRARAEVGVIDAFQLSSDQTIDELSARLGTDFWYVPTGEGIRGVVVMPTRPRDLPKGLFHTESLLLPVTPPGRGLAELFKREVGLDKVTIDSIRASLPEVIRDRFGLARSVEIKEDGEQILVTLLQPSSACRGSDGGSGEGGRIGCTTASFLAIPVCAATDKSIRLEACMYDPELNTLTVRMNLGQTTLVTA